MKSTKLILATAFMLMLATWLVGCGDNNVSPNQQDDQEQNFTDDFGGYKATDEQPALGDDEIVSLEGTDDANDPLMLSEALDSVRNQLNVNVYSVEMLWGHLELDSSETMSTDWSGSISVERGAIVALRLIRFDAGDYVVRPRLFRQTIDFVSHTKPSFDGILVYVYDPDPSLFDSENTFTFSSGPYSQTYSMSTLADINTVVEVGNNQFSINGFKLERLECGEGFMEGRWVRPASERGKGTFIGRWVSKDGLMLGHIHGHFGTRDDGNQVLFGKWISLTGAFRGFLKGEWGLGTAEEPAATNMGFFDGDIFNRSRAVVGEFSGNWIARERGGSENDNDRRAKHGYFRGQWSQDCE